jgi:hypothetical protein
MNAIPHVWLARNQTYPGSDVRHLAMSREGAIQAYLLHFGLIGGSDAEIDFFDEGPITSKTDRGSICFDPHCVLYGLSFDENGKEASRA